jgi:exocyst complex component 7
MLRLFNTILTQLMNLSKKDLVKYGFLILSAYESLLSLQIHWEDLMGRTTDKLKQKNEFRDGLPQLKALCKRSFPEFIADLMMGASARSGNDTSVKLAPFVIQVRLHLALNEPTMANTSSSSSTMLRNSQKSQVPCLRLSSR